MTDVEQIVAHNSDRTGWPSGPWDGEPDRVEWRDETTGVPCLAQRGPLGAWCGYAAVPPGHSWHGADYDDVPATVHGGLTYADRCRPAVGICHVPRPGEPADVWWLGFDCAHAWDVVPGILQYSPALYDRGDGTYRDLNYVRAECTALAGQIAAAV